MSKQQKLPLRAYMVALQWSDGIGSVSAYVVGKSEEASAMAVLTGLRTPPISEGHLSMVIVQEIPVEWLRWAAASIESGMTDGAPVVRLVQPSGGAGIGHDFGQSAQPQMPRPTDNDPPPEAA